MISWLLDEGRCEIMLQHYFSARIRKHLDSIYERLKERCIDTSVLGAVRAYEAKTPADKELWTLFCATVNFQMPVISTLNPMLKGLISEIEGRQLKFIDLISDEELAGNVLSSFKWQSKSKVGFKHRFLKISRILCLFNSLADILANWKSLGNIVRAIYSESLSKNSEEPMEHTIKNLAKILRSGKCPNYCNTPTPKSRYTCTYFSRLIPNPERNSSMKRLCLFFRWMVRPYPDLGLWTFIDKAHLLTSVDVGIIRSVNRAFKANIRTPTWNAALKITKIFRQIDERDPTKYDYVLSRPAIMGYCTKDYSKAKCYCCPLNEICKSAHQPIIVKSKPIRSKTEHLMFEKFLEYAKRELKAKFDNIITEYPINHHSIDAVLHETNCNWWIIEVESGKLQYEGIGRAILYRRLFRKIMKVEPKVIIICQTASQEYKEACEVDLGIKVLALNEIK